MNFTEVLNATGMMPKIILNDSVISQQCEYAVETVATTCNNKLMEGNIKVFIGFLIFVAYVYLQDRWSNYQINKLKEKHSIEVLEREEKEKQINQKEEQRSN